MRVLVFGIARLWAAVHEEFAIQLKVARPCRLDLVRISLTTRVVPNIDRINNIRGAVVSPARLASLRISSRFGVISDPKLTRISVILRSRSVINDIISKYAMPGSSPKIHPGMVT
jgi:hypothetical protein